MPSFRYRARDKHGALMTGLLEAPDRVQIEASLDKMGLIPISIASNAPSFVTSFRLDRLLRSRVPQQEIILFSRQMATLFGAGVPLTRALFTLERQIKNPAFGSVVKKIREDVEGGGSFSGALKAHPLVFSELYSNMVEAGEAGGILESVLDRLASMLEKNAENRSKIKSATLYPKIVLGAIVGAVVILMNFVVPKFARLYSTFKVDLPLPTRILIALSNAFTSYWYIAAFTALFFFLGVRLYLSTESGKYNRDRLILKVPVFGPLLLKSVISRFSRVLASLYRSGLPILQSLDIVSRAVENRLLESEIKLIEESVRAGRPLSGPMSESKSFPPMVVQMVAVGEDTGNLDEMLEKTAEYYDREVDAAIRNLTTLLEPILLAFIFGIVLFLALAIFLPMWDILKIVRR
ncbi:MAG: type II secretion system F family protein [Deltaproteobacteria bacterium]|nr:type II secretion system F family protein [Deltaproteobacteria bacterium]